MIRYSDRHDDVDLAQLDELRGQAGFTPQLPDVIAQQIRGARWLVSAWDGARMIGFVRAISDGVTNAHVCTMVVHEDYRRGGVGREMIRRLVADRAGVRWTLHARDEAVAFYQRVGFEVATNMMRRERAPRSE